MDQINKVIQLATRHKSKLQQETYQLSRPDLRSLFLLIKKMEENVPPVADCNKIKPKHINRHVIDDELTEMKNLLKNTRGGGGFIVSMIVNFTWSSQKINGFSIALMNIFVFYQDNEQTSSLHIEKCIATNQRLYMDSILPEKDLFLMHQYVFAREVQREDLDFLVSNIPNLFKDNTTAQEVNHILSMLDSKKKDMRIYLCLRLFLKKKEQQEYWVVRLSIMYDKKLDNFEFLSDKTDDRRLLSIIKKLVSANKNPVQRLRSYASTKNLPLYEKTYHVPEETIVEFNNNYTNTDWFNMGFLLYTMKVEHWDKLPLYSGIFPIHLAICLEENLIHFALYIPYIKIAVETQLIAEKKQGVLTFFPEEKHKKTIHRHALNPNLTLPPEDTFLMPYILDDRSNIISENVRVPTNKSLPRHLVGDIEQTRRGYKKKLQQYFRKSTDKMSGFQVHRSYIQDLEKTRMQREKQDAIQQYVYQKPLKQVPIDHVFRQDIMKKRHEVLQGLDGYDTPDDIVDKMLADFNLIDPISYIPIVNPVRAPYSPTAIYQKQGIQGWLSRGGLHLDPISGKEMPTSFVPIVDQKLKSFITKLEHRIQNIMVKDMDDLHKKILLWTLYQNLLRKDVFQKIIKKNGLRR